MGQLGSKCEQCHSESSWTANVKFDHDLAPFALIGKHTAVPCASCHISAKFKDAPSLCVECHRKDDKHRGSLGPDCAACHNPSSWANWTFNHDTQTKFALDGAHAAVKCDTCHKAFPEKLSTLCISCHRGDDVHQGQFGSNCERCHTTNSFRAIRNHF
jgi:hypothetical protein